MINYLSDVTNRLTLWSDGREADNGYLWTAEFLILSSESNHNDYDLNNCINLINENLFIGNMFQREPEPYRNTDNWDRMSHDELFGLFVIFYFNYKANKNIESEDYTYNYLKCNAWTYNEKVVNVPWWKHLFSFSNIIDFFKLIYTGIKYGINVETDAVVESNMLLKLLASRMSWRERYLITMLYKGSCYNPFYHWGFIYRTLLTPIGPKVSHSSRLLALFKTKLLRDEFKSKKITAWIYRLMIRVKLGKDYIEEMKSYYPDNYNYIRENLEKAK